MTETFSASAKAGGKIVAVSADAGINTAVNISENSNYYSDEAELKEMLSKVSTKGYKVLIYGL